MFHEQFRKNNSVDKRLNETNYIHLKYPNHIPIIVSTSNDIFMDKHKFVVPSNLSITEFMYIIRKRIYPSLREGEALFCFIGEENTIPKYSSTIKEYYEQFKYKDNYLLFTVHKENTFGS